ARLAKDRTRDLSKMRVSIIDRDDDGALRRQAALLAVLEQFLEADDAVAAAAQPRHLPCEAAGGYHKATGRLAGSAKGVIQQDGRAAREPSPLARVVHGPPHTQPVVMIEH